MTCESMRNSVMLAAYGELPDGELVWVEQHLVGCTVCRKEFETLRTMNELLSSMHPLQDPSPNLLAQSRMRLDEALDAMPRYGFLTTLQINANSWLRHLQGAPALATLLVGIGFLGGNFAHRYEVAHTPRPTVPVFISSPNGGGVSTISAITQLPGDMVQVSYNRVVPEMAQGTLNDPQIRKLLLVGTQAAATNVVQAESVGILAGECKIGHECKAESDGSGVRSTLLAVLRTDRSPSVRLRVLESMQRYVSQDERVRDAVAHVALNDASAAVRTRAIALLEPVQSDSSVRQVLRTISTTDENPYLRTVSTQALQGSGSLQ